MKTLLITLAIAFGAILLSLAFLGISSLLTGKSRFRLGMCGRVPGKKRKSRTECDNEGPCQLCGKGTEAADLNSSGDTPAGNISDAEIDDKKKEQT